MAVISTKQPIFFEKCQQALDKNVFCLQFCQIKSMYFAWPCAFAQVLILYNARQFTGYAHFPAFYKNQM
jgi:hypothetical protein